MIFLYIGGFAANFLLPMIGWSTGGIYGGLMTGLIQVLVLALFGLLVGLDLFKVIIGIIMIVIGGIFGGMLADAIGIGGIFTTLIILAVQSVCLIFAGVVKGKPKLG